MTKTIWTYSLALLTTGAICLPSLVSADDLNDRMQELRQSPGDNAAIANRMNDNDANNQFDAAGTNQAGYPAAQKIDSNAQTSQTVQTDENTAAWDVNQNQSEKQKSQNQQDQSKQEEQSQQRTANKPVSNDNVTPEVPKQADKAENQSQKNWDEANRKAEWRFTEKDGQWWYYTPAGYWMYHRDGEWNKYDANSYTQPEMSHSHRSNHSNHSNQWNGNQSAQIRGSYQSQPAVSQRTNQANARYRSGFRGTDNQVYTDINGRQFRVDNNGRQIFMGTNARVNGTRAGLNNGVSINDPRYQEAQLNNRGRLNSNLQYRDSRMQNDDFRRGANIGGAIGDAVGGRTGGAIGAELGGAIAK